MGEIVVPFCEPGPAHRTLSTDGGGRGADVIGSGNRNEAQIQRELSTSLLGRVEIAVAV